MEMVVFFIIVAIAFGKAWEAAQGDFKSKGFAIEFAKVALWYIFIAVTVYFVSEGIQIFFVQSATDTKIEAEFVINSNRHTIINISESVTFAVMAFEGLRQLLLFMAKHGIKYYIESQKKVK